MNSFIEIERKSSSTYLLECDILSFIYIILGLLYIFLVSCQKETKTVDWNLCCSFPCLNGGICMTKGFNNYTCDCTLLDFYGDHCEKRKIFFYVMETSEGQNKPIKQLTNFFRKLTDAIRPSRETLQYVATHYSWLWWFVNRIKPLHSFIMNQTILFPNFFTAIPRANMIDTPPRFISSHEYITMDSYYNTSYYARSLPPVPWKCPTPMGVTGKKVLPKIDDLINKLFNRKKFILDPHGTNLLFAYYAQHFTHQFFRTKWNEGPGITTGSEGVDMSHVYGSDIQTQKQLRCLTDGKLKFQILNGEEYPPYLKDAPVPMVYPPTTPEDQKFALGHPFYGLLPGLFMFATIWLREHNRVCDVLRNEHPEWDDEQLFQTARLILLVTPVLNVGMAEFVNSLVHQHAGALTRNNHAVLLQPVLKSAIKHGRQLRLQSYNEYRKRFGLEPKKSFFELTGDEGIAKQLEEFYGSIDAVEFYVGLFMESPSYSVTPPTMVEIGGPYSVKGLLSNPICSPLYWKPSTFGGDVGFDIVKSSSLSKLFCQNIKGKCPLISFKIPESKLTTTTNDEL
uniref:prostaglandin-endoperoxide synthase n=1 Tax=Strigamia maritima TaxID=126957 RepID=T1IVL4_STRMM